MKARLIRWSKPLLSACLALFTYIYIDIASVIFFGEYEFPTEE